jgi:hypothetical protein
MNWFILILRFNSSLAAQFCIFNLLNWLNQNGSLITIPYNFRIKPYRSDVKYGHRSPRAPDAKLDCLPVRCKVNFILNLTPYYTKTFSVNGLKHIHLQVLCCQEHTTVTFNQYKHYVCFFYHGWFVYYHLKTLYHLRSPVRWLCAMRWTHVRRNSCRHTALPFPIGSVRTANTSSVTAIVPNGLQTGLSLENKSATARVSLIVRKYLF